MTLTLGTQFQVDTDGDDMVRVAGLSSTAAIALYSSAASGIEARHLTNTDGVLTGGTVLLIDANQADTITICRLSNTSVLIGYGYGATHTTRILTVTGTTLTANAVKSMTDTGIDYATCELVETDKVIYCYSDSSLDGIARILTISGTTITENAAFAYFSGSNARHNKVGIWPATSEAMVLWTDGNDLIAEILDISGTTITGNAEYSTTTSIPTSGDSPFGFAIYDDTGFDFANVYVANTGTGFMKLLENQGSAVLNWSGFTLFNAFGNVNTVSASTMDDDGHIAVFNSTTNQLLSVVEYSVSGGDFSDSDTSVSTVAATSSVYTSLLPNTRTIITVWEGTTEAVTVSLPAAPSTLSLAAMTKPADIDADGEFIYLALLDGGTPILTKISTALDADGTTIFNPGAGTNVGVECGRFSSDTVWVAGNFDGTNVVEKSEDGGSSFVVKDDATIGDVRTFVMGPDSDEKLLVFDETNGDILETKDNGTSWDSINASVTPEVNAIARLGKNVQESVFGNDGGASNSINYSVNSGDDLEDFQTGVYPNANATKVIVN